MFVPIESKLLITIKQQLKEIITNTKQNTPPIEEQNKKTQKEDSKLFIIVTKQNVAKCCLVICRPLHVVAFLHF